MRELTTDEQNVLLEFWFKKLDRRDAMPEIAKLAFIAGLSYQDKRIETLEAFIAGKITRDELEQVTK